MRHIVRFRRFYAVLFMTLALSVISVRGQDSVGPGPKKARTLDDYQPSTLKKIVAIDSEEAMLPKGSRATRYSDLIPFRVRVVYAGLSRPISARNKDALTHWTQCCAGNPDQFTKTFDTEIRVEEKGRAYWLAIKKTTSAGLMNELQKGQTVTLYLIRVAARRFSGQPGSALLAENFRNHN